MTLPQFPREPVRPDLEGVEKDRELWTPRWKCFCCHDSGLVNLSLIKLVIPDYNLHRDKFVVCQNRHCEAGADYRHDPNYDQRFTVGICMELDKRNREDWHRTVESHFKTIQNRVADASRKVSLRKCDRTSDEELVAIGRHESACNADPEKLEEAEADLELEDECEEKAYHGEF
ncbi:hypothetical protein [Chroococcidiopsis sp.]|uniref:hypothetical protein n=1 Tax=Chroococcidiopsis sp. TaxID=3088168 RepID=UPI003F3B15F9